MLTSDKRDTPARVLLTAHALAQRWDMTEAALYQLRHRGEGPPFIMLGPKRLRYALDEIEAFERARGFRTVAEAQAASPDQALLKRRRAAIARARSGKKRRSAQRGRPEAAFPPR